MLLYIYLGNNYQYELPIDDFFRALERVRGMGHDETASIYYTTQFSDLNSWHDFKIPFVLIGLMEIDKIQS